MYFTNIIILRHANKQLMIYFKYFVTCIFDLQFAPNVNFPDNFSKFVALGSPYFTPQNKNFIRMDPI